VAALKLAPGPSGRLEALGHEASQIGEEHAMPPRPVDESAHDAMVRAAISKAEASAGRNDLAFLKAFRPFR
jgi:hypothetical protein